MKRQNIIYPGYKCGKLIVIEQVNDYIRPYDNAHIRMWKCKCECGNETIVRDDALRAQSTKSCGCLSKTAAYKHGYKKTKLYREIDGMKKRCYNTNYKGHEKYKDKKITICDEWLDKDNGVKNFCEWALSHGYKEGLSLDRIDNSKGYSPENCRWGNSLSQANNRDTNVRVEINGEEHTIAEWERIKGYTKGTVNNRLKYGSSLEEAILGTKESYKVKPAAIYFEDEFGNPISQADDKRIAEIDNFKNNKKL